LCLGTGSLSTTDANFVAPPITDALSLADNR
jgi:hypothetical protein